MNYTRIHISGLLKHGRVCMLNSSLQHRKKEDVLFQPAKIPNILDMCHHLHKKKQKHTPHVAQRALQQYTAQSECDPPIRALCIFQADCCSVQPREAASRGVFALWTWYTYHMARTHSNTSPGDSKHTASTAQSAATSLRFMRLGTLKQRQSDASGRIPRRDEGDSAESSRSAEQENKDLPDGVL